MNKYELQVKRNGAWVKITTVATEETAKELVAEYKEATPACEFRYVVKG